MFVYNFLKLFFVMKNKKNQEHTKIMFSFQFFFFLKNIENVKLKEYQCFQKLISKIVFKNRPLGLVWFLLENKILKYREHCFGVL